MTEECVLHILVCASTTRESACGFGRQSGVEVLLKVRRDNQRWKLQLCIGMRHVNPTESNVVQPVPGLRRTKVTRVNQAFLQIVSVATVSVFYPVDAVNECGVGLAAIVNLESPDVFQ